MNLSMSLKIRHAAVQWEPAPTQVARARRNGMGEKHFPRYRAVCFLFSAHINF